MCQKTNNMEGHISGVIAVGSAGHISPLTSVEIDLEICVNRTSSSEFEQEFKYKLEGKALHS